MRTLVTGASRGIGLEHVRQALAAGEKIIATCRDPATATDLQGLAHDNLRIEALDVASRQSIDALAGRLSGVPIDVLINNAGVFGPAPWPEGAAVQTIENMDYALWEDLLRVNLVAPFRLTATLLPNLLASERRLVAMMSSELGSIGNNCQGQSHAYRSSKAALNMVARGMAIDLRDRDVTVIALAPGWTRTDLGGTHGDWSVEDSVAGQRKVLAATGPAQSGQFIDLTGKILDW